MRYLIVGLLVLGAGSLEAQNERTTSLTSVSTITVADAMTTLGTLIDQPAPATLSPEDLAAYQKQTEWLQSVLTRMETVAGVQSPRDAATGQASGRVGNVTSPRDAATGQASGRRQYAPIKLTKELGALRVTVESESRQFTSVSNVLKTRHDTAMNSIRNMK